MSVTYDGIGHLSAFTPQRYAIAVIWSCIHLSVCACYRSYKSELCQNS